MGVYTPRAYIKRAYRWSNQVISVTDVGDLQVRPRAIMKGSASHNQDSSVDEERKKEGDVGVPRAIADGHLLACRAQPTRV